MLGRYAYDPARTYVVDVDFLSGDERFANDVYAIDAATPLAARRRALLLAGNSVYADPRIPDLRRVVHSAELAESDSRRIDLLVLLADAHGILSACIADLDRWASAGPGAYTPDERQRRDDYARLLDVIAVAR